MVSAQGGWHLGVAIRGAVLHGEVTVLTAGVCLLIAAYSIRPRGDVIGWASGHLLLTLALGLVGFGCVFWVLMGVL